MSPAVAKAEGGVEQYRGGCSPCCVNSARSRARFGGCKAPSGFPLGFEKVKFAVGVILPSLFLSLTRRTHDVVRDCTAARSRSLL